MINKVDRAELDRREAEFQWALKKYRETGEKQYWDIIYYRIYDCCHNIAAKKMVGIRLDPETFEDRVTDAALYCLKRVKQGLNPGKLSSYCYLCVIGRFYSERAIFEDRNITYVEDIFPYIEAQQEEII